MRAVVDTNVFVSSFLSPGGKPRKIIDLWKTGEVILCLSPSIIEEYVLVHAGFAISRIDEEEANKILGYLEEMNELEELQETPEPAETADDVDDDIPLL